MEVYLDYGLLKIFVMDELGERLTVIVHEQPLEKVAFDLVEWAEAKGRLDELFAAFCRKNPRHVISSQLFGASQAFTVQPSSPSSPPAVSPGHRREVVKTLPTDRVAPVNRGDSQLFGASQSSTVQPSSPSSPPAVSSGHRREVIQMPPTVPVVPVNSRDSTVAPTPPPPPPPKRDAPTAKVKTTSEPQLTPWRQWVAPRLLIGMYGITGLILAFSDAPPIIWAVAVVVAWFGAEAWAEAVAWFKVLFEGLFEGLFEVWFGAVVWAVVVAWFRYIAVVLVCLVAEAWFGAEAWAEAVAEAVAWAEAEVLAGSVALGVAFVGSAAWAVAWDEWDYIQTKPDWQKVMILRTLAILGLALGAILALPFDFTIPADWSDLPAWLR